MFWNFEKKNISVCFFPEAVVLIRYRKEGKKRRKKN